MIQFNFYSKLLTIVYAENLDAFFCLHPERISMYSAKKLNFIAKIDTPNENEHAEELVAQYIPKENVLVVGSRKSFTVYSINS